MAEYSVYSYSDTDLHLLPRPEDSHKGTFGKVLCVCGSVGMCGAAYFAAKAAYRAGAGLVRILTPKENRPVLQGLIPEALVTVYDTIHPEGDLIAEAMAWADVLVVGCGLGTAPASEKVLASVLRAQKKPMVLDADALNLLALHPALLPRIRGAILTPHGMEMSRLCGKSVEEVTKDPKNTAYEFAKKHGVTCVLKSHRTVVSDGGSRLYVNESGNSGMATGGSGDVLAGLLGGLWAQSQNQNYTPQELAALAVHLHGRCGDFASEKLSPFSVMASDLLDAMPAVMKRFSSEA